MGRASDVNCDVAFPKPPVIATENLGTFSCYLLFVCLF